MANATSAVLGTFRSGMPTEPARSFPASGSAKFYAGALVGIPLAEQNAGGNVAPLVVTGSTTIVGVSAQTLDTTGLTSGQTILSVMPGGVYALSCSATSPPTTGSIDQKVYATDDHTVTLLTGSSGTVTFPLVGTVWSFEGLNSVQEVFVLING